MDNKMIAVLEVINPEKAEGLIRGFEQIDLAVRIIDEDSGKQLIIVNREQFGEEAIDWLEELGITKEIGT